MISNKKKHTVFEWFESLVFAISVLVIVFVLFFRVVTVQGSSMNPTLLSEDRIMIGNSLEPYKKGDIIVVDSYGQYGKPLVKRVIATEGDTIYIDAATGGIIVNDRILSEPYIAETTKVMGDQMYPLRVPENCCFAMGDNRNHSTDSRFTSVGFIHKNNIMGVAKFRLFPFSAVGVI